VGRLTTTAVNDINILNEGRTISRNHFHIDYSNGFKQKARLPDEWVALLMMNHDRLGRRVGVSHLPNELLVNILTYTVKKRTFYVEDNGSSYGTHKKVHNFKMVKIMLGEYYLIGSDYLIKISQMNTAGLDYDINDESIVNLLSYYKLMGFTIIGNYSEAVLARKGPLSIFTNL
jgi:hypothetical protein